ncbi:MULTISPECIES: hypothetical protein [Streptomyces]|uniref:Uncharacterized protein n=2 Tax=Streptomyces TaxID=1883 RepID=A0A7X6HXS9_9ACTN|nr:MULTISPECIES: hypothetical protein [Streptomyces]NJP65698.1 hypothetical protein [Streptomyces spiramenti]NJQ04886.1 hypothetical protein [Streptomyces lonarensis]
MVEIPVDKLKNVIDLLMERIQTDEQVLDIEADAFWSVPRDQAYNVYSEPQNLTIGMLSESWGHLEDMLSDPDRVVGHGFVWLSDVLRAIGDEASS